MIKKYKFLFLLLFGLFIFIPKDTFAISFTESGYSCYYSQSGEQICSNLTTFRFPNNQNGIGPLERLDYSVVTSEIRYIVVDFYNQSFCASEGTGGTFEGWIWFNEPHAVTNFNLNIRQGGNSFNCTTYVADEYGLGYKCVVPKSFNNATLTYELTPKGYDPYGSSSIFTFGIGTYTVGTQTCVVDSSLILENDNKNTDKIIESNEQIKEEQEKTNEELGELNDNLTDNDTSDSQSEAKGFFDDFESDDFGLSDIITMPLTFIQGLSSSTCYSLNLPLPFVDTNVSLPCMTSIYQRYFGAFLTLYQTITTGIIAYWCCINIFRMVQGFKNPDSDEIEVMDL